jgi:hypothetical protein
MPVQRTAVPADARTCDLDAQRPTSATPLMAEMAVESRHSADLGLGDFDTLTDLR